MPAKHLTRKDIARLTDLSVDVIRRNEKRLGLEAAKVPINPRLIRYRKQAAILALIKSGLMLSQSSGA